MKRHYKTAFADNYSAIAILLDDGQSAEAFKINIPHRKAEKLRRYFNGKTAHTHNNPSGSESTNEGTKTGSEIRRVEA